jgi:signal transduction histidine kinase
LEDTDIFDLNVSILPFKCWPSFTREIHSRNASLLEVTFWWVGLGLFTTASIVSQHGGLVDAKTELAEGTEFRVYLPAVHTAERTRNGGLVEHYAAK